MTRHIKSKLLLAQMFCEGKAQNEDYCGHLYVFNRVTTKNLWCVPLHQTLVLCYRDAPRNTVIIAARNKHTMYVRSQRLGVPAGGRCVQEFLQGDDVEYLTGLSVESRYDLDLDAILTGLEGIEVVMSASYASRQFYVLRGSEWLDKQTMSPFTPTAEERMIVASGVDVEYMGMSIINPSHSVIPSIKSVRSSRCGFTAGVDKEDTWFVRDSRNPTWYPTNRKPEPLDRHLLPTRCICLHYPFYDEGDVVCRVCSTPRLRLVFVPRYDTFQVAARDEGSVALIENSIHYGDHMHSTWHVNGVVINVSVVGRVIRKWGALFPFIIGRNNPDGSRTTFTPKEWDDELTKTVDIIKKRCREG